ncbi:MAG: (Fe-S)-binding protein [Deltaproteobacteria bacterium]|nr:MAG: (Fe-S)-binding protein [Deltaproteobacteria bacterium]
MTRRLPPSPLDRHAQALALCTYCPSLCRHACPVATAESTDTTSPWGLVSLVEHLRKGRVELDDEVARHLYHCANCRACTEACVHDNDVEEVLVAARAWAVGQGVTPFPRSGFERAPLVLDDIRRVERFERRPAISLLPGRVALDSTPRVIDALLALCERLDIDAISCGEAAALDVGYDLWFAGFHTEFVAQARKVHAAISGAQELVVMSPEALYTLSHVYPRYGLGFEGALLHTSDLLLQLLGSAVVKRVDARVAYHDSCHLARHLDHVEVPRQVLRRVLSRPIVELASHGKETLCCGGTGCLGTTAPGTSRAQAEAVIAQCFEAGVDRVVSFSPECVDALRAVAPAGLRVDHAVSLVAEAIIGDSAAG